MATKPCAGTIHTSPAPARPSLRESREHPGLSNLPASYISGWFQKAKHVGEYWTRPRPRERALAGTHGAGRPKRSARCGVGGGGDGAGSSWQSGGAHKGQLSKRIIVSAKKLMKEPGAIWGRVQDTEADIKPQ